MKKIHLFIILCLFMQIATAQVNVVWEKLYGTNLTERVQDAKMTKDSGFVFCAYISQNGGDYNVIKTNSLGELQWNKTYGGTASQWPKSISTTLDNGYLVAGYASSTDAVVLKNNGKRDAWIIKLDSLGVMQWQKVYGGSEDDYIETAIATRDSGYLLAGYTSSIDKDVHANHGKSDVWLLKLDTNGDTLWTKCIGGTQDELSYSILENADGDYVITFGTGSSDGDLVGRSSANVQDYCLMVLDTLGNIKMTKWYHKEVDDVPTSIKQTIDKGYIISGKNDYRAAWIVKVDSAGIAQWEYNIENRVVSDVDIIQTLDSAYILSSTDNSSQIWALHIDADGKFLWEDSFSGTCTSIRIVQLADSDFVVMGEKMLAGPNWQFYMLRFNTKTIPTSISSPSNSAMLGLVYPNPTTDILYVSAGEIGIYDLKGKKVYSCSAKKNTGSINVSDFPAGVYVVKLRTDDGGNFETKIVKL